MGFGHKSPSGKDVGVYKTKPWQSLRDKASWFSHETEDNVFGLRRRRIEWGLRMGGIYFLTILYAVSSFVQDSAATGTYPILANFYATYALTNTVASSVLGCLEMARGVTVGALLAVPVISGTLAADEHFFSLRETFSEDDLREGVTGGAGVLLFITLVLLYTLIALAPGVTFGEKQMALFCLVSSAYNGLWRLRSQHVARALAAGTPLPEGVNLIDPRYDV